MSPIVIKLGGELMLDERRAELDAITADVAALVDGGHTVVVVHGGGKQTTSLQRRLGQTPNMVAGRRITDAAALEAITMMVGGQLNIQLTGALVRAGVSAVGLNGVSSQAIACVKRPPRVVTGAGAEPIDFGHVGDVSGVNDQLLGLLMAGGYTPVLACIGSDAQGAPYNINADVVANGVAVALAAAHLVLVTGAPGVLLDREDPSTRIERLTIAEGRKVIADGVVVAGMIPKLEESFLALEKGVGAIHVVGDLRSGDLVRAIGGSREVGTTLVA